MRDINEAIEKNINFEMQVLELRKNTRLPKYLAYYM